MKSTFAVGAETKGKHDVRTGYHMSEAGSGDSKSENVTGGQAEN